MEVVVNCNVPTCNRKHNIIFIDNKAIISLKGFFKKVCHWEKKFRKNMWKRMSKWVFLQVAQIIKYDSFI